MTKEFRFGPEYAKINTVFKRDMENGGIIIPGQFSTEEFAYLADTPWRWTEKVDGTNIRVHFDGEKITVGGRTNDAQIPGHILFALAPLNNPGLFNKVFADSTLVKPYTQDVTIYGEGYGPKIQSGGQYRDDVGFIVFDILIKTVCPLHRRATQIDRIMPTASVVPVTTKLGVETGRDGLSEHDNGTQSIGGRRREQRTIARPTNDGISSGTGSPSRTTNDSSGNNAGGALSAIDPSRPGGAGAESSRSQSITTTPPVASGDSFVADATSPFTRQKQSRGGFEPSHCTCRNWWLKPEDVWEVASKLGLEVVPYLAPMTLNQAITHVAIAATLGSVEGNPIRSFWPKANIEGIVGTPLVPLFDRKGERIITKLKVADFVALGKHRARQEPHHMTTVEALGSAPAQHRLDGHGPDYD